MKLTLPWLHDHLETSAPLSEITETLTRIGLGIWRSDNPADRLPGSGMVFCGRAARCQRG